MVPCAPSENLDEALFGSGTYAKTKLGLLSCPLRNYSAHDLNSLRPSNLL